MGSSRSIDDPLGHHRFELVVDEVDARRAAGHELLDRHVGNLDRVAEREALEHAHLLMAHVEAAAAEKVAPFASDQPKRDIVGRPALGEDELLRGLDDIGIEASAQTAVGGDDDEERTALRLLRSAEQRMRPGIDPADQTVEHLQHALRKRACRHDTILRPPQARGGDHLHRLGNLLRRLHRADAATQIKQ